jgi:ubiquinone/menaquinone biosynthesis C-methylase UbiE
VDISEAMLDRAKRYVTKDKVQFHQADLIEEWNFQERSFELIVVQSINECKQPTDEIPRLLTLLFDRS